MKQIIISSLCCFAFCKVYAQETLNTVTARDSVAYHTIITNLGTADGGMVHYGLRTGNYNRWFIGMHGQESGSESGGNFSIWRYGDAGQHLSMAMAINRQTGTTGIYGRTLLGGGVDDGGTTLQVNGNGKSMSFETTDGSVYTDTKHYAPLGVTRGAYGDNMAYIAMVKAGHHINTIGMGANNSMIFGITWPTLAADNRKMVANMAILPNGNVGIGTLDPQTKLAVNGDISAKKVKVTLNGWPDYVFTKSYPLPTLQDVAAYIEQNGHLPGMPSASEVFTNGIELGEINKKLLEKIEELTLHLIRIEKELLALKKWNAAP